MEVSRRRKPRQERSKVTVDAILEATAQVLADGGYARLNTNRVARVAGVSIGSLYQYFSNKDELVRAVIEKHSERVLLLLRHTLMDLNQVPIQKAIQSFVEAVIEMHSVDPELHRFCVQHAFTHGMDHILDIRRVAIELVAAYLEQYREHLLPNDLRMAASILVGSVDTLVHGAILQKEPTDWPALAQEIVALVVRYLGISEVEHLPPV